MNATMVLKALGVRSPHQLPSGLRMTAIAAHFGTFPFPFVIGHEGCITLI
jgi:hypothetical protein